MSVTLISPPPAFSFSADKLSLKFQCTDMMETVGSFARTGLIFHMLPIPAGNTIEFKYGLTTVIMTSANAPDDSGYQFPSMTSDIDVLIDNFNSNYVLSNDFNIFRASADGIYFVAKKQSLGYDIAAFSAPYHSLQTFALGAVPKEKPSYSVLLRLLCENAASDGFQNIYETSISITYGSDGIAERNIGDILHDYISSDIRTLMPDIPTDGVLICNKSCRKYYFEYAESYGTPIKITKLKKSGIYTILHGGLSTQGEATTTLKNLISPSDRPQDRFLKQGPLEVLTREDQPQYLYFFNTRELVTIAINCRFYFTDGSIAVIVLSTFSLAEHKKFGYNMRFDNLFIPEDYPTLKVKKYEIWLTDSTGAVISESRFYLLDYDFRQYFKYFLNWSSWGTMDTRMFHGKGSVEFDLVQSEAEKIMDPYNISQGNSLVFDISIQTKFSLTTGFIKDKSQLLFNRDFFLSPLKYLVSAGLLLPVKVTSKTITEFSDGENLYAQKFDWQYLFDDHSYTEGDVYQSPVITPPPLGQVYFGSMASRPLTDLQVKALSSQSPDVYLFPLATGLNRFFVVAVPPGKAIGNVYSQTTDENLTSEFLPINMVIDGLTYRVYVMEMAIPFSINNTLIISLINVE